jgi:putative transposase
MPHDLPPWQTVYPCFRRWQLLGYWQLWNKRLPKRLHSRSRKRSRAPLSEIANREAGQSRGYDSNKRCSGRKRHILVESLGSLLLVVVTAANVQDRDGAKLLLTRFYHSFLQSFCLGA